MSLFRIPVNRTTIDGIAQYSHSSVSHMCIKIWVKRGGGYVVKIYCYPLLISRKLLPKPWYVKVSRIYSKLWHKKRQLREEVWQKRIITVIIWRIVKDRVWNNNVINMFWLLTVPRDNIWGRNVRSFYPSKGLNS